LTRIADAHLFQRESITNILPTRIANAQTAQNIRSAAADDGNLLSKFGRGMPNLAKKLEQRAREFSKPPVGPIGTHIKLKDQQWAGG
jgi:hypothetical protein